MFRSSLLTIGLVLCCAVSGRAAPGIVVVADGAGDYRGLSTALRQAVADAGLPLEVEPAAWSHGYRRSLVDQIDRAHHEAEGRRLAGRVLVLRDAYPDRPIYLLSHSAGAGVVLAAASCLPPHSVERIVLLAPTVSAHADLRPALRAASQGVDVFSSARDCMSFLVGVTLIGSDGRLIHRVAGRVGFLLPEKGSAEESKLYARLGQHCWDPSWKETGHDGRHFGIYQQGFLHAVVLPLLTVSPGR